MKRIVLATDSITENGGGISSYAIEFVIKLKKLGFSIIVITNETEFIFVNSKNAYLLKGTQIYFSDNTVSKVDLGKKYFHIIEEFDPDILFVSYNSIISSLLPFFSRKYIVISISHFYNGILTENALFNHDHIDWIIALSYAAKKLYNLKKGIPNNQIKVIYNFVNAPDIDIKEIIKQKNSSPVVITYVGGANYLKNADGVLAIIWKMIKWNEEFEFNWVGNTKFLGGRFDLKSFAPKDKRIIFKGKLSRAEINDVLIKTNFFLLPSRGEGCPISLIEAMSYGCIPIVSNSPNAMREIVDYDFGFVCETHNYDQYLQVIKRPFELKAEFRSKAEKMYLKSYANYKNKLTSEIWASQIIELFENNRREKSKLKLQFDPKLFNSLFKKVQNESSIKYKVVIKMKYIYFWFRIILISGYHKIINLNK